MPCVPRAQGWWNTTAEYRSIEQAVHTARAPRAIISQHHTSPSYVYIASKVIAPWRRVLESKGCRMVTSVVLREQPSQAKPHAAR